MDLARIIRENRATVICALVVAAVLAALWLALGPRVTREQGLVALVHDADGRTYELPLDHNDTLTVTTSLGSNTIAVEDGAVRMADADCPNRTCLQVRPLSTPGPQIICLPHKLWIEVVPQGEDGGELDVSRAENLGSDIDLQAR